MHVRRFVQDVMVVLVGQVVVVAGGHVAGNGRSPSGKDEHDVFAQRIQLTAVAGAETFAQSHQQQQRSHAPGNTEHGQEGA